MKVVIRPATLDDANAMNAVQQRNGMPGFDVGAWRESVQSYPFANQFRDIPIGWVLESEHDGIVGTLTNVHMLYEVAGAPVKAALAGSWAVDHAYRDSSLLLSLRYLNQKGIDLCVIGSASRVTSHVMRTLRIPRVPLHDFNVSLLWVTDYRDFATSFFRKKHVPIAAAAAVPAGAVLYIADRLRRPRWPKTPVRRLDGFSPAFDTLWDKLRNAPGTRLRAVRTSAALRWRFGQHLRNKAMTLIGLDASDGALAGYCVLTRVARQHLALEQYVVADLQCVDDNPAIAATLLEGAIETTAEDGLDLLELRGGHSDKRAVARSLGCREYDDPVWPAYYKALNRELSAVLADGDPWDLLPFDVY